MDRPDKYTREYVDWRNKVYRRDGRKCKKCGSRRKLQVHHIKRWADYPALRYEVGNGIVLCKQCHAAVWGKEEQYEAEFYLLISPANTVEFLRWLYEDN